MIEHLFSDPFEHPTRDDADYHFMLTLGRGGEAELHAVKDSGSGWFEYGAADRLIPETEDLAHQLAAGGYRVVVSYASPDPILLPRGRANLRRIK